MRMQSSIGPRSPALCLKLPLVPYIVCANSEGSGETVQMPRLTCVIAVRLRDKYPFHVGWLIYTLFNKQTDVKKQKYFLFIFHVLKSNC